MRTTVGTRPLGLVMLLALVSGVALSGCAVTGRGPALHAAANPMVTSDAPATADGGTELQMFMEKALKTKPEADPEQESAEVRDQDYDPWETFNERMFNLNYAVDRKVVKPAAAGWSKAVPEPYRKGLQNAVRNVGMPRRFVNNLLQLKVDGALRELTGFVLNSTLGLGGIGDVARAEGIAPPDEEDTGQTLAVYGVEPGPYLVLPLFAPSTVRDTIGSTIDGLLDPVSLVMPLVGSVAKRAGTTVNDRSLNLQLYEDVEASVLDLYSGVPATFTCNVASGLSTSDQDDRVSRDRRRPLESRKQAARVAPGLPAGMDDAEPIEAAESRGAPESARAVGPASPSAVDGSAPAIGGGGVSARRQGTTIQAAQESGTAPDGPPPGRPGGGPGTMDPPPRGPAEPRPARTRPGASRAPAPPRWAGS